MGAEGKKRYEEQFRGDKMVARIEALYQSVLTGGDCIEA
jgi:hypothetical protein